MALTLNFDLVSFAFLLVFATLSPSFQNYCTKEFYRTALFDLSLNDQGFQILL